MRREIVESILWLFSIGIIVLMMLFVVCVKNEADYYTDLQLGELQKMKAEDLNYSVSNNSHKYIGNQERYPVLAVSSVVLIMGIMICVYFLVDYPSVDVYTYDFNKKLRKIGRIVVYKNGEILYGTITKRIENLSETGQFQLRFNTEFAENNYNLTIIIKVGNTAYRENVKDKINLFKKEDYAGLLGA